MAVFYHGWPHEIWGFPFHYFMALRREYLKVVQPKSDDSNVVEGPGGMTIETYEIP